MIQSIKVDIVYYMTATDFEFEFNLGGCCHMRLLNDKTQDKKGFVNSLARAVSRSQIILCVGPIFGEDGLISTTATAINRGFKTIDNATYGISAQDEIKIISGSIPLVTPEGYFGGCIIESGNQTIILLTENRTIRKSIMKTLIHPYIEDMSLMQSAGGNFPSGIENIAKTKTPAESEATAENTDNDEISEPETPQTPEIEEEPEVIAEEEVTPEFEEDEPHDDNDDINEENNDNNEEVTAESDTDINDEVESDTHSEFSADQYESEPKEEETEFIQEDYAYDDKKGGKGISISILIITIVLLLAVLALCYFLIYIPMQKGISTTDYIGQLFDTNSYVSSV